MADDRTTIAHDETERLISSSKVEGTAVFDPSGDKLGTIRNFMVEKRTGQVEYAILSTGGMFGGGGSLHPLPWQELRYDVDLGGYVVETPRDRLAGGPSFEEGSEPRYDDEFGERIRSHYRR